MNGVNSKSNIFKERAFLSTSMVNANRLVLMNGVNSKSNRYKERTFPSTSMANATEHVFMNGVKEENSKSVRFSILCEHGLL